MGSKIYPDAWPAVAAMWWVVWTATAGAVFIILYRCRRRLGGKVVLLTGGDKGVGYETARELAARGARVILACEDAERGTSAADRLRRTTRADVQYRHLDLSSLASVRAFAASLLDNERRLDVLINNASVSQLDNSLTEDGIVVEMQINHFGPFLLTVLLLPLLKNASQGRIVNATSVMHYLGNINVERIGEVARDSHAHKRALATSRLCQVLLTSELARRLRGTRVTANCFHPGVIDTKVQTPTSMLFLLPLFRFFDPDCFRAGEVARTSVFVASSPSLARVSGKYFVDCKETMPSKVAQDEELARKLWTVSERLTKLSES